MFVYSGMLFALSATSTRRAGVGGGARGGVCMLGALTGSVCADPSAVNGFPSDIAVAGGDTIVGVTTVFVVAAPNAIVRGTDAGIGHNVDANGNGNPVIQSNRN